MNCLTIFTLVNDCVIFFKIRSIFLYEETNLLLGATKHLYNWLCPLVCRVTHSFDDPHVAPYWPTWPCFLGATKHLYNWLCPLVGLLVCLSVTHSFVDPNVAPYWPTWPCFLISTVYSLFYEFSNYHRQPYLLCNRMKFILLCLFYLHPNTRPNSPTPQLPLPFQSSASMTKSLLQKQYTVIFKV